MALGFVPSWLRPKGSSSSSSKPPLGDCLGLFHACGLWRSRPGAFAGDGLLEAAGGGKWLELSTFVLALKAANRSSSDSATGFPFCPPRLGTVEGGGERAAGDGVRSDPDWLWPSESKKRPSP